MKNDGGPAYPCRAVDPKLRETLLSARNDGLPISMSDVNNLVSAYPGMTLRDYFAGQALAANPWHGSSTAVESQAKWAYELADAMLRARTA